MKSPDSFIRDYLSAQKNLREWVEKNYPKGKKLIWLSGKYAGRSCEVNAAFWYTAKDKPELLVTVRTSRIDGKQGFDGEEAFIDSSDSFHRQYREVNHYFKDRKI